MVLPYYLRMASLIIENTFQVKSPELKGDKNIQLARLGN